VLLIVVPLVVLALAAGAGAFVLLRPTSPAPAARAWLDAWAKRDWPAMQALLQAPKADLPATYEQVAKGLGARSAAFQLGKVTRDGKRATADYAATIELGGLGPWRYQGRLDLAADGREWRVAWSPAAIHPSLRDGQRLTRSRTWPERAEILARDGTPLVSTDQVVVVGVQPGRIKDRQALLDALERDAGADPKAVAARLDDPKVKPDWFLPVAELSKADYAKVKARLYPVPGTVFRDAFGRVLADGAPGQLVGTIHEATAEDLTRLGPGYQAGDQVGASGLERASEAELAGRPSGQVALADKQGKELQVLASFEGVEPKPLRTTIDTDIQAAADHALAGVQEPASLVAVQPSTGAVRAVVNHPDDQEFNAAFSGSYPPGSTFKVVTTAALLAAGRTPTDQVDCPSSTTVDGRRFRNFEGGELGTVPFSEVFAQSCNTAFVRLAGKLPAGALVEAARRFGFETDYGTAPPAATARFPDPGAGTGLAAAAIGQGKVTASPLHMATVAAAVADGTWRPPVVLDGAKAKAEPVELDPAIAKDLRGLMTGVVERGSGTRARTPGHPLAGKTGTAEFGNDDPPRTHAWFIGFSDDLAFAVLVEGGGVGGRVAAPLAGRFLAAL